MHRTLRELSHAHLLVAMVPSSELPAEDRATDRLRELNGRFDGLVGLILDDGLRATVEKAAEVSRSLGRQTPEDGPTAAVGLSWNKAISAQRDATDALAARIRAI